MITEANAASIAREFFKFGNDVPASVYFVNNLQNQGKDYFLVIFGGQNASVAIAAVDSNTGEMKNFAMLTGKTAHLRISKDIAYKLANADTNSEIEMVWLPCSLSRSPLYPIWKINSVNGVRYVNQEGVVANSLESGMRG